MISITFRDFYKKAYDDTLYDLYIVKDGETTLYIGISNSSIYVRWFGGGHSHMIVRPTKSGGGYPVSNGTTIGRKIEINYPESSLWTIELWTLSDCVSFLSDFYDTKSIADESFRKLERAEAMMIKHFKPLYNTMHSVGGSLLSRTAKEKAEEDKYRNIYDEIFNK